MGEPTEKSALRLVTSEGKPPSKPPPDPLVGRTIDGRYLVEDRIGEGGMGLVYKASHTVLRKPLAIKVLRSDISKDPDVIRRFKQEAQSASAIGSDHIIAITDFGELPDGATYFVMEYLDGTDLTEAIEEERPMKTARVVHIAKQLCDALGAAHRNDIVHRDLKPDNVFLVRRGDDPDFVKVLDFGIAKVSAGTQKITRAGQVFGTPHYMSPEQCAGTHIDQRTDIYALGVILYEMCSGRVPFDADNLMGILTKHIYEKPIPPHTLPPPVNVPPALEAVILKCLEKKAEQRYQSMQELHDDLECIERGVTPKAVMDAVDRASSSPGHRVEARGSLEFQVGEPQGGIQPAGRSGVWVGLLALLVAGGVAGWYFGLREPDPMAVTDPRRPAQSVRPAVEPAVSAAVVSPGPANPPPTLPVAEAVQAVQVTVTSEPVARVYLGGALLGNTPLTLERPTGGEQVEIELRANSYLPESVRLSSLTIGPVAVTLRPRAHAVPRRPERPVESPQEPPADRRPTRTGELVNPWD